MQNILNLLYDAKMKGLKILYFYDIQTLTYVRFTRYRVIIKIEEPKWQL